MEALGDYLSHKSNGKEFCLDLVLKYARKYAEVCRKKACQKRCWKRPKSQKILCCRHRDKKENLLNMGTVYYESKL